MRRKFSSNFNMLQITYTKHTIIESIVQDTQDHCAVEQKVAEPAN